MGLCCKRPEILWQLLLCFQPVLRFVGAKAPPRPQPSIAAWISAVNSILTGEFNMFQNALALKLGFYMAFTHCYTEHHSTHPCPYIAYILPLQNYYSWIHVGLGRFASEPGQEGSRPIFIWHLWQSKVLGKGCHGDAMGCHGMPHGTGDVWKFQQRIVKSRTPRKPTIELTMN